MSGRLAPVSVIPRACRGHPAPLFFTARLPRSSAARLQSSCPASFSRSGSTRCGRVQSQAACHWPSLRQNVRTGIPRVPHCRRLGAAHLRALSVLVAAEVQSAATGRQEQERPCPPDASAMVFSLALSRPTAFVLAPEKTRDLPHAASLLDQLPHVPGGDRGQAGTRQPWYHWFSTRAGYDRFKGRRQHAGVGDRRERA